MSLDICAFRENNNIPEHIAIIMDGNGRWAQKRSLPRAMGHRAGMRVLHDIVEACGEIGVGFLTVYAFSTENWERPREEVNFLMALFSEYVDKEIGNLLKKNVRLGFIGCLNELPPLVIEKINFAEEKTKGCTGLYLNIAINYGGRKEITEAVRKIAQRVIRGEISVSDISDLTISENLYTYNIPDPDLLIRPSGELRISNFLLWQTAYTEFWISDVLWPDFTVEDLSMAIIEFNRRSRRYGGLGQ